MGPLFSQFIYTESNSYFEYESQYYDLSYRGIKHFMTDRAATEPETHREMLRNFEKIRRKRATALSMLGGGLVLGIGTGILAEFYFRDRGNDPYLAASITAVSLTIFSVTVPFAFMPRRADFLDFISDHNRKFKDPQIKLGLASGPMGSVGLGLVLEF